MASTPKAPPEATQVGDYIVDLAWQAVSVTNEPVAIKSVLRSKLTKKLLENLASEINILKGIRHDHIVALVDCRETDTHIHLVMEYCSQGDLSQYIKRKGDGHPSLPSPPGGGLNEIIVRHFLKQLTSALEFLRSKNLIHRDLKPQNLLLHPSSNAKEGSGYGLPILKIADFGFARSLPHLSMAETLCGSPLYMAPEILRYEKYDAKADLWSVGTVLYEMCTGKPPFRAQNHVELLKRIEKAQDVINFPGDVTDDRSGSSPHNSANIAPISDDIKDLIRQLLKRNPVERISFEEFFMNPTVSNLVPRVRSRTSRNGASGQEFTRNDTFPIESSKKSSVSETSRHYNEPSQQRDRNERRTSSMGHAREPSDRVIEASLRSRPKSIRSSSPSSAPDSRPPLQLPLSSPKSHQTYANGLSSQNHTQPSHTDYQMQPSSLPINTSNRRVRTTDIGSVDAPNRTMTPQPSSQPYRRSTLVGVPDVARRHSAPEDDALLDTDYVVIEKRAVELNELADQVAGSPTPSLTRTKNGHQANVLSPPIPTSLTNYRTPPPPFIPYPHSTTNPSPPSSANFFSTTPPFALPNTPVSEESKPIPQLQRPPLGQIQPLPSPVSVRSGSPRDGGATSALAKAISMASMRLFGASSSPPSWKSNTSLIGFADVSNRTGGTSEVLPEEIPVLQSIEDTAHKAYVVSQFADSKMQGTRPLDEMGFSPPEDHEPSRDSLLAEEAFFLYLRALALLQSGMDVARHYWEEKRLETKPASIRLNTGVQWIRDRFNECLEKAEAARVRSGIDHRDESGVVIEKLIYERALELSKSAALKELVSDYYGESEKSYQTSIWMLHAILDGAGEDGRSEAIEDDDREILNK
ncbi:Serine/threonine-protein kinase, partial [Linnemannia zychae]